MSMHTKCGVDGHQLKQVFLHAVKEGWRSQSALVQLLQRSSTAFQDLFPTVKAYFSFPLSLRSHKSLQAATLSHPIPCHPLAGTAVHHTLSPLPTICGCTRGKAEERRLKKGSVVIEGAGKTLAGPSVQYSSSKQI